MSRGPQPAKISGCAPNYTRYGTYSQRRHGPINIVAMVECSCLKRFSYDARFAAQHTLDFIVFLLSVHFPFASATPRKFEQWYPKFTLIFETILQRNCSSQFGAYLLRKKNLYDVDWTNRGTEMRSSRNQLYNVFSHPRPPSFNSIYRSHKSS